jgi:hypothetical protein
MGWAGFVAALGIIGPVQGPDTRVLKVTDTMRLIVIIGAIYRYAASTGGRHDLEVILISIIKRCYASAPLSKKGETATTHRSSQNSNP